MKNGIMRLETVHAKIYFRIAMIFFTKYLQFTKRYSLLCLVKDFNKTFIITTIPKNYKRKLSYKKIIA